MIIGDAGPARFKVGLYPKRLLGGLGYRTISGLQRGRIPIVNRRERKITSFNPRLIAAVTEDWSSRHGAAIASSGAVADYHGGGDALAAALAADWGVELVIVDLALATPALVQRLGPDGPRVLAFGDPANAGAALGANLADFIADEPADAELVAAIHAALTPPPAAGVADLSDRAIARLGALGTDAERVGAALARLESATTAPPPPMDAARLRTMVRARRARERFFPADLFGEPAWDMLLDLALAAVEGHDVAVSSLCIAAAVPTTTALRWIKNLCDAGLFERRDDPRDARRAFITLSEPASSAMARYLAATAQPWG